MPKKLDRPVLPPINDTLKETATIIKETKRRLTADPPGNTPAAGAPADLGRGDAPPQPQ